MRDVKLAYEDGAVDGRPVYSKVVGLLFDDDYIMPLEREDKNIDNEDHMIPRLLSNAIAQNYHENI